MRFVILVGAVILAAASANPPAPEYHPPPCWGHEGFTNWQPVLMTYNVSFSYSPKDELTARGFIPNTINDRLNEDGAADNNSFKVADGVLPNLIMDITITNDGNDHLTAYANVSGLGHAGKAFSETSGDASFVDPVNMLDSLADRTYSWLHNGWHCNK